MPTIPRFVRTALGVSFDYHAGRPLACGGLALHPDDLARLEAAYRLGDTYTLFAQFWSGCMEAAIDPATPFVRGDPSQSVERVVLLRTVLTLAQDNIRQALFLEERARSRGWR